MTPQLVSVWIAGLGFAVTVLGLFAKFWHRIGAQETRLARVEEDGKDIDARIAELIGKVSIIADNVASIRLHAAENFVSLDHMQKIEAKLDGLSDRTSEHGALLKALGENLAEVKRGLERLRP
jgi:hypothetical protein